MTILVLTLRRQNRLFSLLLYMPLSSHIHAWLTHLKNDMCKYPTISSDAI